MVSEYVVTVGR